MTRNNLCVRPDDTYVLFKTFLSPVYNKCVYLTAGCIRISARSLLNALILLKFIDNSDFLILHFGDMKLLLFLVV